ncbi:MAG: (d)CMP kinase [Lachnospiraceae bacterium]|nr:(d)CMP kinase [Lachnospiraceae bacterium]
MTKNIAIDGPAGAGKSTIAKMVAKKLGFIYIDTGAMYRAMGLYMMKKGIKGDDTASIVKECDNVQIELTYEDGVQQVILNGENVSGEIRTDAVGKMASDVAKINEVRIKLVSLQQLLAQKENVVMDGRDIGTQVLPNADLKIFMTASSKERAKRRYLEYKEKGIACDIEDIEKDIIARDEQDMNREISPLKQAEDAIYLDTSDLSIEEVVEAIISKFH